jgi:hypothetical protein
MSSNVNLRVLYKIANAPIQPFPFPHIYVRDVFPEDFYQELRRNLPPREAFKTLTELKRVTGTYPETRLVLPLTPDHVQGLDEPHRGFWQQLSSWMLGGAFGQALLLMFTEYLEMRFGDPGKMQFHDEALVVQDYTTYSLGPHTDTPMKVLSCLFYLPADDAMAHLGTSIYVPKDPGFHCAGGPHYPFAKFDRMVTMPFLPNSLFAFLKTPNAFHGVEPIAEPSVRRDLLLYDIKVQNPPETARMAPATQAAATPAPTSHFSF